MLLRQPAIRPWRFTFDLLLLSLAPLPAAIGSPGGGSQLRSAAAGATFPSSQGAGKLEFVTGTGDVEFIKAAVLGVERCSHDCSRLGAEFRPLELTAAQTADLKRILISALRRNRRDEVEARRHRQVTGGVYGFVTYGL